MERLLDREETTELAGPSGTLYQLEVQGFRDGDSLRVIGSVDNGGWRAFAPLTDGFLIAPDGSFVGE